MNDKLKQELAELAERHELALFLEVNSLTGSETYHLLSKPDVYALMLHSWEPAARLQ